MRLLSLDYDPVFGEATLSSFDSSISIFDYDVVIWDPAASMASYWGSQTFRGLPSLDETSSVEIQGDAQRRRAEFVEFVNSGRALVVIARPPQKCYVDTGDRNYSGTGRNQKTTVLVRAFDLNSAIPVEDIGAQVATGNQIEFSGGGPVIDFFKRYKAHLRYEAILAKPPGEVTARVSGTDLAVASAFKSQGGGLLLILPAPQFETTLEGEGEGEEEIWPDEAVDFQDDLLLLIKEMTSAGEPDLPEWAKRYGTVRQRSMRQMVIARETEVETARKALAVSQVELSKSEARNQLYLGTGGALEREVRQVLELLGGQVTEPPIGRDDWRVEFPGGKAVVEVKGLVKSAAEKHAAQLEKWVAIGLEETGDLPKGILVANTWRQLPLAERTEASFPAQMLSYSTSRNHCLVTGVQLFVIREDIERDPSRAEFWREKIMATSGVLEGATEWTSVIQVDEHELEVETEAG